ncbi:MAG: nucleoside triphosphate pyrophosphohydrolase [Halioglobus sp.]
MTLSTPRFTTVDLLRVMERLRDPESGCPWDVAQTFETIVPSTLEECYELAAAIENRDYQHVAEELGDVLFQVVFYAQLGSEEQLFSFDDVVHTLVEKLLRRHPHVFNNGDIEGVVSQSSSVEQVAHSWEAIKQDERNAKQLTGLLEDVPRALPALPRAQKLQKRAAAVGFDWDSPSQVFDKLQEELSELSAAVSAGSVDSIEDEMGDVLFTCVNLARHLKIDAETSLRRSSSKFESRFRAMESMADEREMTLHSMNAISLEDLWMEVKQRFEARD